MFAPGSYTAYCTSFSSERSPPEPLLFYLPMQKVLKIK